MSEMVNRTFIEFLKKHHAFAEYKEELVQQSNYDFTFKQVQHDIETDGYDSAEYIMSDGYCFFFKNAVTTIAWRELEQKWREIAIEKKWIGE